MSYKMIVLVTTKPTDGIDVAEAWQSHGWGVTIVESHGLRSLQEKSRSMELVLAVSLSSVMDQMELPSQMLFSVVHEEDIDSMIDVACEIVGDLENPDTGIAFTVDIERVFGLKRYEKLKAKARQSQ